MSGARDHAADPRRSPWRAARDIYAHLPPARRRQLFRTVVLMVAGAAAELATIGAVLPFLAVITGGAKGRYADAVAVIARLGDAVGLGLVAVSAALLIAIAATSAVVRLTLIRTSQSFVFTVAHDLAAEIYDRTLHQPYTYHVAQNSSRTIAGIDKVQFVLSNVLLPAMLGTSAAVVALFILAGLIAIDPATSMLVCLCFILLYAAVSVATRRRLYRNSETIAETLQARLQTLQEGLGGIRDVLLDHSQPLFLAKFDRLDRRFRNAQAANQFIAAAPRHIVEAGGVVLIALLALYVSGRPGGLTAALPMLGALALGAQRLLPLVQQVYFSWSQIYGNRKALDDVAYLLDLPRPPAPRTAPARAFADRIELDRVTYRYPTGAAPALSDISLTIPRGMRIGFVGKSGSGKSTLADLIMGLLDPSEGTLRIDGDPLDQAAKPGWQAQIAHVPQAIFLADSSIAANIAFGRDAGAIDIDRIHSSAQGAGLRDFVESLPDGFATAVGERGIRLSGGQRQRIGIARALYKGASVLVLDEATSALDTETEASVMTAIDQLSRTLTIISIAHRVSTLRACDLIVRLDAGRIVATGPYREIVAGGRGEA
ncbi:MAG TPA: ABC transporter ATP-binding protein [Sphingomonas sp.]|nr:ABC transporter ATP-binding protein [Sphingomonas sp.]